MTDIYTTTDAGNPAPSDDESLTVGPDGPILLQDHYLIEQMANFNRERIQVHWYADGEMVRAAYTLRPDDDDWGQAGTLVREVLDDAARERLADNVIGHMSNGVREPVLSRVFEYWRNVDPDLGKTIEERVRANLNGNSR